MDWKLELVAIPVSDVDRAKAFYVEKAGFIADHDHARQRRDPLRPADAARLGLLDRDRQRASPTRRRAPSRGCRWSSRTSRQRTPSSPDAGVEVSDVQEFPWGSFVFFSDPDGNALGRPAAAAARRGGELTMDLKLELVLIPVSDVDRAKAFYTEKLGWSLDVDHQPSDEFRVVQMTPPGSACSITIGIGITEAEPGSYRGTHLVVYDIDAAREELVSRGRRGQRRAALRPRAGRVAAGLRPRARATTPRSPTSPIPTATPGCCRRSGRPSRP